MQTILRLKKGSALSENGLATPLARAVDYMMTTAGLAEVVGLTRASGLASGFVIPRQNTSRRLLQASTASSPQQLLRDPQEIQEKQWSPLWPHPVSSKLDEAASEYAETRHGGARELLHNVAGGAPSPMTDMNIVDAVVQLTVSFTLPWRNFDDKTDVCGE